MAVPESLSNRRFDSRLMSECRHFYPVGLPGRGVRQTVRVRAAGQHLGLARLCAADRSESDAWDINCGTRQFAACTRF